MTNRRPHRQDNAEAGCQAISIVAYLQAANEKLRQAVVNLTRETTALRQELEARGRAAEAETRRQNDEQQG